jgi:hypothetical protein
MARHAQPLLKLVLLLRSRGNTPIPSLPTAPLDSPFPIPKQNIYDHLPVEDQLRGMLVCKAFYAQLPRWMYLLARPGTSGAQLILPRSLEALRLLLSRRVFWHDTLPGPQPHRPVLAGISQRRPPLRLNITPLITSTLPSLHEPLPPPA